MTQNRWWSEAELKALAAKMREKNGLPPKPATITEDQRTRNRKLVDAYHKMRESFGLPPVTDSEAVDAIMQNNRRSMKWADEHPIRASVLSEVSEVPGE